MIREDFATVGEMHDATLAWTARLQVAKFKGGLPPDVQSELDDTLRIVSKSASLLADDDREPTAVERDTYESTYDVYAAFIDLVNVKAATAAEQDYAAGTQSAIDQLKKQLEGEPGLFDQLLEGVNKFVLAIGTGAGIASVIAIVLVYLYLTKRKGE